MLSHFEQNIHTHDSQPSHQLYTPPHCTHPSPQHHTRRACLLPPAAASSLSPKQVNNDAGNAAAGFLNIQKSFGGKVAIRNFPGATAATAVGNAVAGGVTIAYSEAGKAQIGDYDQVGFESLNLGVQRAGQGQGLG